METFKPQVWAYKSQHGGYRWVAQASAHETRGFNSWFDALHYVYLHAYGIEWQIEVTA